MVRKKTNKKKRGTRAKEKKEEEQLSLPTDLSVPVDNLGGYSLLLYGKKKIGKTTLASEFPGAFFMMTEPGGRALRIYQRPITTWAQFLKYKRMLKNEEHEFGTVVIDTIDRLYEMCFTYTCRQLGIAHPRDENDFGASWNRIKSEFSDGIDDLLNTGLGVIFISHDKEEKVKTQSGEEFDRLAPSLTGQGRGVLEALVDLWFHYGYEGHDRLLTLRGTDYIDAGLRPKEAFLYTDGSQVRTINVEGSSELAYEGIVAAFNNELEPPEPEPEPVARKSRKKARRKKTTKKAARRRIKKG